MDKYSFFEMLIERWKSENLEFFNVILKYALLIGGFGAALVALPEFTSMPAVIQKIGSIMVSIGAGAAFVANLTTKNATIRAKAEEAAE